MATDVVARLRLRAENFAREVRKAFDPVPAEAERAGREAGQRMGTGISGGLKATVSVAAVASVVREIAQLTSRAVDFGVEMGNTARLLNTSVEELQAYREAASDVNVVHAKLDDGLQELLKTMVKVEGGDKDLTKAFKELGVSLRDTDGHAKSTTAVMGEVIDQLRRIPDPLRQAQYGTEIFGDKWADIAPLLDAGSAGLQQLTQDILGTGDALSTKEIQELERINSEFERMKSALEVDVSKAVAVNADAIIGLASALAGLATSAIQAASAWLQWVSAQEQNAKVKDPNVTGSLFAIRPASDIPMTTRPGKGPTTSYLGGLFTTRPADRKIRYPKGGRGGGRLYGDGRLDDSPSIAVEMPKVLDPINPARLGGGGGGKPKKSGGGISKEAREAEQAAKRLRAEYDRIGDSLDKDIEKQRVSAEVEALRAMGLDREAEKHEAINEIAARYPKLIGKTAEQLAKEFGITIEDAEARLKQLEQLRLAAILEVDVKYDKKAADEAAKSIAAGFKKQMEAQQKVSEQYREQEAEAARRNFEDLSGVFYDLFDGNTKNIWDNFKRLGLQALSSLAANQTLKLLNGEKIDIGGTLSALFKSQKGDTIGNLSKGLLASSLAGSAGLQQSKTGATVGSLLGQTKIFGNLLSSISSSLGPFGSAIGGLLGGTLGGLFKKAKTGSASLGVNQFGDLGATSVRGNSGKFKSAASATVDTLGGQLASIAEQLGATLDTAAARVSIGIRNGKFRVDPTGNGQTKTKRGAIDFGEDEQAAIRYALADAIKDGVLTGISDASQRILKSGQDIETALEKALLIEELPKKLKARFDPVGAALDEVDAKFAKLAKVLAEGGGSAEQIAQARQLWQLERADAIAEIGQASATLRDYLKTLRIGADSPLSLRTQAADAEAALSPYIAQIRAAEAAKGNYDRLVAEGGSATDIKAAKDAAAAAAAAIDQSGFRDSAALFLDVSRQLGGSTKSFFDQFDRIQGLTNSAIALVENAVPLRGDAKDPFAELTAKSTQAAAAILDQHTALLQQIANGTLGRGYVVNSGDTFIGGGRSFTNNALR